MSAADDIETPPRRRRIGRRILVASLVLLVAGLIALWLARVPIATGFIDRRFADAGVPARYGIADLGFGHQRLTDVVIGDPASPDLVADWIETRVAIGRDGPYLARVAAGRVRLRGRLVDGRVSLGALDRLLPAPSGKPFALPTFDLAVDDARMRLETAAGIVGLRLTGSGRVDDGFRGRLAAVSPMIAADGCTLVRPQAVLAIGTAKAAPRLRGPVRASEARCGDARVVAPAVTIDMALGAALDRWSGTARLVTPQVASAAARVAALDATLAFAGTAARTAGRATARSGAIAVQGATARAATFDGQWRIASGRALVAGRLSATGIALPPAQRRALLDAATGTAGTPIGPLAAQAARALAGAASGFAAGGEIGLGIASGRPLVTVHQLALDAPNGMRATFGEGGGIAIGDPAGMRIDGVATAAGGGLPAIRVTLAQARPGATVDGSATMAPYAAGGARLALGIVRFVADDAGLVRLVTAADLSGPLGDGRVERLRLPIVARRGAGGRLVVNPACTPLAFDRLALSGLVLRPARLGLCPLGAGLVTLNPRGIEGGARIAAPRLAGTLGSSPVQLAAAGATVRMDGFTLNGVRTRIGAPERMTRIDAARLDGRFARGGVDGRFAGAGGQIGNVPLLLSGADGAWRFAAGILSLEGGLTVSDAAPSPRFLPLAGREVALRLAGNLITATGVLRHPAKGMKVADVTLRHDLGSGRGDAHLAVPGITFGDGFQPEELTPLTFGVIADVKGTVNGAGDIAWTPDGVTSTGTFATAGTDLAAAFGPVTGIRGTIRFTDLLALESAPGQVATVASINPGVPVNDGRIVYQTLPDTRVRVEGGRWPFAGGTLTLEPTLLDFSAQQARRLTFRVDGMEARQFLQQFDFKNLDATGIFDGVLPMIFDDSGGRIENGRLTVREGGGGLAYVGELTEKDLGVWGNIAFQALKALRYRNLDIVMNGPLAGEMITEVRFAGVSQGEGAKSNFLIRRLQRLPFVFNIRIKAPFRGLLDSAASFYDPKRLIERNLPALLDEQNKRAAPSAPVQPPASEKMP